MEIFIPESEVRFEFMRSSGPGGQNVNKVETKVRLFWDFGETNVLSEGQKETVREKLEHRMNKNGELYVSVDETRSQEQNRQLAVDRMRELVARVLLVHPERKLKVPKKVKRKRQAERREVKGRLKQKKKLRKDVRDWD